MDSNDFFKRIWPLGTAQTLGVFNDNAFKSVVIFVALGLSGEYSTSSFFIALMTVVYVSPFILFAVPSGYLADKFSKRNVIVWAKFAEIIVMLSGAVFFYFIPIYGIYPVVIVLFLMAAQSSAFSPSYNSILPEIFTEAEISRANGILGMFTFLAVIIGFSFGIIVKALVGDHLYICGLIFSFISVIGFLGALNVRKTDIANRFRKWNSNVFKEFVDIVRLVKSKKDVFISMLGEAYFFAIGASIQTLLILFGKFTLRLTNDLETGLLLLITAIGMGIGCYLGGYLSKRKLELGLAPFGALGMIIFFIITPLFRGPAVNLLFGQSFTMYPVVLANLIIAGIFAGIFVIPLRVCQQERTKTEERGKILACSNFFAFSGILLSGIVTYLLTGRHNIDTNLFMRTLNRIMFDFSPGTVLTIIAIFTFLISAYAMIIHCEFFYRAIVVLLTRIFYKVVPIGEANIPQKGAALMVSNHVSFWDTFFISSCTSRKIRFVINKDYYKHSTLRRFYKYCDFIQYPERSENYSSFYQEVNSAISNGEIVCIFPEGRLTRNGFIGKLEIDISKMLNRTNVPVIPVNIANLWGSIFSCYYQKIKIRPRLQFFEPVKVSFGQQTNIRDNFQIRQKIAELSAEAEMLPNKNELCLHTRVAKLAKRYPFRKSFIDYGGDQLNRFSMFLRSILLSRKIRNLNSGSQYMGVLLPNCNAAAASILGVMMADKTPVILNYTVSNEIFDFTSRKADLDIILTSKLFIQKANIRHRKKMVFLEDIAKTVKTRDKLLFLMLAIIFPHKLLMKILSPKSYRNLLGTAVVLFSSGSTGVPKGVALSHHNLNSNINAFARIMKCADTDKITGNLPLFHSFGINICFWVPLMSKLSIVYIKNPLDSESVIDAIKKHKLTLLMSTPTFLQIYMKKSSNSSDFQSLRLVILGAEKMRSDLAREFKKYTGLELIEGFGCTELSPVVSINTPESIVVLGKKSGKHGSIGPAIPGVSTKIVDIDSFKELAPNSEGLLFVKGPNIMKGYLGEPEETRKVIIDGWYNTGDIARMDEAGFITITGRLSRFSKIGGEMISHEFVEYAIHEILKEEKRVVAVTGVPDATKGEKLLVVYEKLSMSPKKIVKNLQKKEIPNLWIPNPQNFIKINHIPVLGTGKLDINKLNKIALSLTS